MKVGLVIENDAPFVTDEVRALRDLGLDVSVVSAFRPRPAARWRRAYGSIVHYPDEGALAWAREVAPGAADPRRLVRLARTARREGAPLRLVLLATALASRARREGWQHLHGSFAAFPAWLAWAAATLADLPFSFTGHAYDVQMPRPWVGRLVAEARFVRAISQETAARLRRLAPPHARARVRLGRLGVDVERFRPGRVARALPSEILCVAHLGPTKGHGVLLEAAARLRDARVPFLLRLLGDGPERGALLAAIRRWGLGRRVRLEGRVEPGAVADALARASIFALPCTVAAGGRHDGVPVALLEAMAAGLPVIATPVGGIPEVVRSGREGLLVPPEAPDALAQALARLLCDAGERRRLGLRARDTALRSFRREDAAARLARWMAGAGTSRAGRQAPCGGRWPGVAP